MWDFRVLGALPLSSLDMASSSSSAPADPKPGQPVPLESRAFSSETLAAGLQTVDFQQIKNESVEALEAKMKELS